MKIEAKVRLLASEELSVADEAALIITKAYKPAFRIKNATDTNSWAQGPAMSAELYKKSIENLNKKGLLRNNGLTPEGKTAIDKIQTKYATKSSSELFSIFREKLK